MKAFRDLNIGFKIIFTSAVLAAVFLGTSFGYAILKMRSALLESNLKKLETEVTFERNKIQLISNQIKNSLLAIKGTPPFQGIIRAKADVENYDEVGRSTLEQWRERLKSIFTSEIKANDLYLQMRYLDENGVELVRVNAAEGQPVVTPDEELQDKSDRPYFIETKKLGSSQIYVSQANLNREGNPPTISRPHAGVIRYASPVYSQLDASFKGIIIINVSLQNLINKIKVASQLSSNFYIVGPEGYFIHHPNVEKEWGGPNNLNTGYRLSNEFNTDLINFQSDKHSFLEDPNFISYVKLGLFEDRPQSSWTIVQSVPKSQVFGPINSILSRSVFIGFSTFVLLFFIFLFVIQQLLKPLTELFRGVERVRSGDFGVKLKVHNQDEIGKVTQAFNAMAAKLKKTYHHLEKQVGQKTKDLSLKVGKLEKTQSAMANILEDIEEDKRKFETVLRSIGDGVFVVDRQLNILIFNEVSERLTGYSSKEAVGRSYKKILKFVYKKTGRTNDSFIKEVFKTGRIQEVGNDTQLINREGKRIEIADSAAPLKDSEGNVFGAVVVFRDVSKEREIDKAKTEFVSLASHQLRTPLTAIGWYSEMLLNGDAGKLTKQQKDFIKEVYEGNRRMVDLVNALLNVSRIELGKFAVDPEWVDLKKLAKTNLFELQPMIRVKQMKIKEVYRHLPKKYLGDPKLLMIILQNLISNAIKYTPEKGEVKLMIEANKEKDLLQIQVSDTGYGIPKKSQSKIFTKLFRADNIKQQDSTGTGLGLYIIKAIVEASDGKIWFESKEKKGTTFYIELPLSGMKKKKGSKPLE